MPAAFLLALAALSASAVAVVGMPDALMRYDASWHGLKVGEMEIETGTSTNGVPFRRLSVRNSFLARAVSRVDTEMLSETFGDGDDRRIVFTKSVSEDDFSQRDTMVLWPERGIAEYVNLLDGTSVTSRVDVGILDVATFFCGLGDKIAEMDAAYTNRCVYKVVNDGMMHEVEMVIGKSGNEKVAGKVRNVRTIELISRSDKLFVRNRPGEIKVASDSGAIVEMTVLKPFGNVRFRLRE